jgi:hypothetical protein
VIFVVDANDKDRLLEARAELETMSEDPALKSLHLLILGIFFSRFRFLFVFACF